MTWGEDASLVDFTVHVLRTAPWTATATDLGC
jgi:hypothetical protein